jgi:hypothetical protein
MGENRIDQAEEWNELQFFPILQEIKSNTDWKGDPRSARRAPPIPYTYSSLGSKL